MPWLLQHTCTKCSWMHPHITMNWEQHICSFNGSWIFSRKTHKETRNLESKAKITQAPLIAKHSSIVHNLCSTHAIFIIAQSYRNAYCVCSSFILQSAFVRRNCRLWLWSLACYRIDIENVWKRRDMASECDSESAKVFCWLSLVRFVG